MARLMDIYKKRQQALQARDGPGATPKRHFEKCIPEAHTPANDDKTAQPAPFKETSGPKPAMPQELPSSEEPRSAEIRRILGLAPDTSIDISENVWPGLPEAESGKRNLGEAIRSCVHGIGRAIGRLMRAIFLVDTVRIEKVTEERPITTVKHEYVWGGEYGPGYWHETLVPGTRTVEVDRKETPVTRVRLPFRLLGIGLIVSSVGWTCAYGFGYPPPQRLVLDGQKERFLRHQDECLNERARGMDAYVKSVGGIPVYYEYKSTEFSDDADILRCAEKLYRERPR